MAHEQNCLLLLQLAEKHSAVADDSAPVAGDIGGGSVLDEFGVVRTNYFQSGQHRNGRAQAAHGDFFFATDIEESARIEVEDLFDSQMVFSARGGVVLIMIEIGSGEQKHFRRSGKNVAERFADGYQLIKLNGAQCDGNKREARIEYLQKRQLDFQRMFAFMRDRIFAQQRARMGHFRGQFGVDWRIAEWSAPSTCGQDRGFRALGKMAHAQNDDAFRKRYALINGAGDMPRICVACMGHETSAAGDFFRCVFRLSETLNLLRELLRIFGIKRASDCGKAKHNRSGNQLAFEGLPLTLRAFLLSGSKNTVTLSPY